MARALLGLAAIAEPVDIHFLWRPQTRGPNDEMILEAAVTGAKGGSAKDLKAILTVIPDIEPDEEDRL